MNKKRIYELDVLRTVAIILILLYHLHLRVYTSPIESYLCFTGLCIFFFLAGFLLYKYPCNNTIEVGEYIKNKIVRIFPLYWLSLLCAVSVFIITKLEIFITRPVDGQFSTFICQAFALQFLQWCPTYPAMWYIGALVFLMLIYAMVAYYTKNEYSTVLLMFLLYIPLKLLTSVHILHSEIVPYYPMFVIGIGAGLVYNRQTPPPQLIHQVPSWVSYISYASFATYLFHECIYAISKAYLVSIGMDTDLVRAFIIIPFSIMIGYIIQYVYDITLKKCELKD